MKTEAKTMAEWYVKDLSKLTGVSVQTLHHYDKISLLKPSHRLPNGYRLYTEQDLLKLQQIIALKYFGFELSQINHLLQQAVSVREHFTVQSQLLETKANDLLKASQTLNEIIETWDNNESIPWETIIHLIEVYRMTQQLEKTWAGKVFTPEQLKEYAAFEAGLKTRFTESEKKSFEKNWTDLIAEIGRNIDKDPTSDLGIRIGRQCMEMINNLYGKKHANLKHTIWEKGYKGNNMDSEHAVSPDIVQWLDKAIDTYYRSRIYGILAQVNSNGEATPTIQKAWEELLEDMYGDVKDLKQDLIAAALKDDRVSDPARIWLKKFYS